MPVSRAQRKPGVSFGFSVVIPTYRRRRSLERVLEGLRLQQYPHEQLEVIVVNDGGDDGTAEMVKQTALPFAVHLLEQGNLGPGAARNLGVERARGPFVLFLDDDVVPASRLVAEHAAAHGDRDDLVVIGTMLGDSRERRPWLRWESATLAEQYAAMDRGVFKPTPWQFYTGNASLRREHIIRAGGFDVRFRRAEDIELGFRLERLGLQFVFHREAAGLHLIRRTWSAWLEAARQYGRNDVAFGKVDERVIEETSNRHPYTLRLIRFAANHRRLRRLVPPVAKVAGSASYALGASNAAMAICGAVFNLNYWLGIEESVGSPETARLLNWVQARAQSNRDSAWRKSEMGRAPRIGIGGRRR
jgi:glycosyltransferase involved in cell wall biosynthesis